MFYFILTAIKYFMQVILFYFTCFSLHVRRALDSSRCFVQARAVHSFSSRSDTNQ